MKKHASLRAVALLLSLTLLSGAIASCASEKPPANTTAPLVSTVISSEAATESDPPVSTADPEGTTSEPIEPAVTDPVPTDPPESTTASPEATGTAPTGTTASPETTQRPAETTQRPAETTQRPPETTQRPPETTQRPPETTQSPPETTQRPAETTQRPAETTQRPAETTQKPAETTQKPPETTQPDPTPASPPASGTLLYSEDFEGYGTASSDTALMDTLGWKILSKADGAHTNNSASYALVRKGNNTALAITNYRTGFQGNDSYVQILSERILRYLNGQSYTYQYDITYGDSSDDQRYIVLVSSFTEGFYNSGHLRVSGRIHNECHTGSSWKSYGASPQVESRLGISGSLKGITVSVRYVVDWDGGCRIYARRVDTDGDWVLLTSYDATANGASLFDPSTGGSAFVLKVGGAQNGTVDNILLWTGTAEPMTDTPYLSTDDTCHRIVKSGSTAFCVLCGRTEGQIKDAWLLSKIPAYDGGVPSREVYLGGQGLDPSQPKSSENRMQVISGTDETQFSAYLQKLKSAGYRAEFERTADGNRFASYINGSRRVYAYYIPAIGEARIVSESTAVSVSVSDFSYTYEVKPGDVTAIYQYALPLRDATHFSSGNYVDRGMLYVVKLADNKVVLVDGGESVQFTSTQVDGLMSFLREITGAGSNGKVTIAAWYLTHAHQDHIQGFCFLAKKYSSHLTLERVFYNIPSVHSPNSTTANVGTNMVYKLLRYIRKYFGSGVEFLKLHTGQEIRLANVTFEVLYTHEDLVHPETGETRSADNYNEASSVMKITFDGQSILLLGDVDTKGASTLMRLWSESTLKVSVLQVAHHVLNVLTDLYHLIKAPILFVPQSLHRINEHSSAPKTFAAVQQYADPNMIFFQNEKTVGLAVVDGAFKVIYTRDIIYESQKYTWPEP